MGSRINCAKCHNHPFENWTQNDYYRIGAVFSRVKVGHDTITLADSGEMRNPTSGEIMLPWGAESAPRGTVPADRRQVFVHWLTKPGNPFFARVAVNRIWAQLLGRGIVHPVDDFRSSNPPANAPLLDALANDFEAHGYDRKAIIRTICNSHTYQRSTETNRFNESDQTLFSHYLVRRLSAEQLSDAIGYATQALPMTSGVEADLTERKAALEKRLAALPGEFAAWEAAIAKRIAAVPFWTGQWHSVGWFSAKRILLAHETVFPPEKALDLVDLQAKYDGKLAWEARPDWKDTFQFNVPIGDGPGACYMTRTIYSQRDETAVVDFRSSSLIKIWLNGQLVRDRPERKNLKPAEERLKLPLKPGENRLLLKVSDGVPKKTQIQFKPLSWGGQPTVKLDLPHFVVEGIARGGERRSAAEQAALGAYHRDFDPQIRLNRIRIDRLTWRLDYATQRPFPEQSDFLLAFGQPKRETACACERLSEPTVDQALQLLNGQRVYGQLRTAVSKYSARKAETLLDELYLAALARYPSAKEREAATAYLAKTADRKEAIRDLVWAIVNTQEFLFQH
jgi:hypothetical protein